ncbi:MAG: DUF4157 domain-containing protein [Actinomycetales bacterium]|nr:DUF4157 domain-containing protein [Actinomycetales bacterium]
MTGLWWVRPRRELDADDLAANALGLSPSELARSATAARRVVLGDGIGHPLDDDVRADLEARFAVDLTQVRVRPRDERVASRGALAETVGTRIAFAPGRFAPRSPAGRELLAHEVAHVVQGRGGAPATMAPKKDVGAKPFHQEVIDEFGRTWGKHEIALRPILALCGAVDAEQTTGISDLVAALDKVDGYLLPTNFPSGPVAVELTTRLVLLGHAPAAARFRNWYLRLPGTAPLGRRTATRRYYDDEVWHWGEVRERLRARVDWSDGTASLGVLDGLGSFFHLLQSERDGLDKTELVADTKRVKELYESLGGVGFGFETKPNITISRYAGSLVGLMRDAFVGVQAAFQAVLERAVADLAATKNRTLLDALEQRLGSVLGTLSLPQGSTELEINEWVWRKRGRKDVLRQVDFFPDDKRAAKREITLESYDATDEGMFIGPAKEIDHRRIVAIRTQQIGAVKRIYGFEADKQGRQTAEAKENEAALPAAGADGLQLHSDDDWRRFLLAKFEAHLATSSSPDESLTAVIDLLRLYLAAFTTHSPMNIEDLGDDLLRVSFPRTLAGQLVHDCGVYALRITYLLSLLRNHPSLALRFRWIQLPVHIGLIVTGAPGLSTWVVHNDEFKIASAAVTKEFRDRWDSVDASGEPRAPRAAGGGAAAAGGGATRATDNRFLGELAANEFVENTDAPFLISDVPDLGGKSEKVDKDRLVAFYRSLMHTQLFGSVTGDPKSPYYQFHLRYLQLLEKTRAHHNTWLVPYWNVVAHPAWQQHRRALEQARSALLAAATPQAVTLAQQRFAAARTRYLSAAVDSVTIPGGLTKVVDAAQPIQQLSGEIIDALTTKPEILAKGVSRASAARVAVTLDTAGPWWKAQIDSHLSDLGNDVLSPPPFAEEKDRLRVVD